MLWESTKNQGEGHQRGTDLPRVIRNTGGIPIRSPAKDTAEALQRSLQRGEIPEILYLFGDDQVRIDALLALLKEKCLCGGIPEFNFNHFDAKETPAEKVVEALRLMPMMCPRRLVVVRNASSFDDASWATLERYLREPSPSCCLVLRDEGPPRGQKIQRLIKERGWFVELRPRSRREAHKWLAGELRARGKHVEPGALWALIERVGTRHGDLIMELEKLLAYVGDSPRITEEQVQEVSAEARTQSVFELTDAISEGRTAQAISSLHRLLEEGHPPLKVVGMLARQTRLLWTARLAREEAGEAQPGGTLAQLEVPKFVKERLLKASSKWSIPLLIKALRGLHQIDRALKGGSIGAEVLLDRWIMEMGRSIAQKGSVTRPH